MLIRKKLIQSISLQAQLASAVSRLGAAVYRMIGEEAPASSVERGNKQLSSLSDIRT